jgi:hypothetical protein
MPHTRRGAADRGEYRQAAGAVAVAREARSRSLANRRFPPPWSIEDIGATFVEKDS